MGCGGLTEERLVYTNSNVSPGAFTGNAATVASNRFFGSRSTSIRPVSVSIDQGIGSSTSATVEFDGRSEFLFEDEDGGYSALSLLGKETNLLVLTALPNGPVTPDVLYLILGAVDGASSDVFHFVDGNASSRTPSIAQATYNGSTFMIDNNNQTASGTMQIDMNFASNSLVGGTLSGALPSDPSAVMAITAARLDGAEFTSSLTSNDVSINSSFIRGQLFGSNADQLAGEITVDTTDTANAGLFSTTR